MRGIPVRFTALALGFLSGCAWAQAPAPGADLQARVQSALNAQSNLPPNAIRAAVAGQVVTLQGVALDPSTRAIAERAARSVSGVTTLNDQIEVNPSGALTAASEVTSMPSAYPISDMQLQSAVMGVLMGDPRLGPYALSANVSGDRAVEINGTVPDKAAQTQATNLVQSVPGVASVRNKTTVVAENPLLAGLAPPAAPPTPVRVAAAEADDDVVQGRILDALFSDPAFSGLSCTVSGKDVTLAGEVAFRSERLRAEQTAAKLAAGFAIHDLIIVGY